LPEAFDLAGGLALGLAELPGKL